MKQALAATCLCAAALGAAQAQVYRCEHEGRTIYQQRPCSDPAQSRAIEDRVSVYAGKQPPAPTARGVTPVSRAAEPAPAREHPSCAGLRQRIRHIDAQARLRSTASLTEQRHNTKARLSELACAEMDPR